MDWTEMYNKDHMPDPEEISSYIRCRYWNELCDFIDMTYAIKPSIEYSRCSGAPGWNVKYKRSGRSLCTLYPNKGYFTCLISIGRKEAPEAELILTGFSDYLKKLYQNTTLYNGSRWLMIDVTSEEIRKEVEELMLIRMHPPKKK